MRFAADTGLLASVRDFAVEAAEELGARIDTEVLAVIVGELAANAAVHQYDDAELAVSLLDDGRLHVSVCDPAPERPKMGGGEPWDVDGHRGLQLVAALADEWGVDPRGSGKEVWARLAPVGPRAP